MHRYKRLVNGLLFVFLYLIFHVWAVNSHLFEGGFHRSLVSLLLMAMMMVLRFMLFFLVPLNLILFIEEYKTGNDADEG